MQKTFFLIVLLFIAFQSAQPQKQDNNKVLIKNLIIQRIDSLENDGLPQSAFKLTDELYKKALSQRNTSLFIKTLLLRMKYREYITEESLAMCVEEMENQIPKTWEPAQQIMHSLLADLYQWYYSQNRWKLLEQRQVDSESNDIREMSASELSGKAIEHYRLSLDNAALLQNEQLDQYKDIIEKESGKFNLRPTLFDLLSVRAVNAMLSDALFQEPVPVHPIFENTAILSDIDQFLALSLTDYDKSDAVMHGLKTLHDWLAFRNETPETESLFDADLTRLRLLSSLYSGQNMEELYENALTNLAKKSRKTTVFSDVLFTKASFLQQLANSESGKNDKRNYLKEALTLAQQGVDAWPESEGAALCKNLIQRVIRPYLSLRTEEYSGIGERFAFRVDYNNIKRIYVNLFRIEPLGEDAKQYGTTQEAVLKQIKNLKPIRTEIKTAPDFGDYLNHSAEFELQVPSQPGMYCLVVSLTPFNSDVKKMEVSSLKIFQITNLTVLHKSDNKDFFDVSVYHRLTGEPLKDVTLSFFEFERYNAKKNMFNTIKTDENGSAHIAYSKDNNNIQIEAVLGSDRYQTKQLWISRIDDDDEDLYKTQLFLFTDRQIYRPGQTVWFKGILMDTNGKEARVLKQITTTISLRDANGQELSSQTLLTNDYGSINGKFTIPANVLTGNFYLQTNNGNHYFNVENYKRPRFEVVMEPFNQLVVLGNEVKTFGKATDMTGAPLQGASVSWRVTREINFRRNWGYQNPVSIASGSCTTGNNGEFEVLFTAVPSSKKTGQFPENYVIEIDVTDVNGETRSQNQTISIAKNAIIPSLKLQKTGFINPIKELPVTFILENHSGENVKGKVSYTISRLLVPQKHLPQSLWNRPDTVLWKGDIYSKFGPGQEEWQNWPDSEVIKTGNTEVDGRTHKNIGFDQNLSTGVYKIQIKTPDKTGEIRTAESLFYVSGNDGQSFNPGQGLLMTVSETEIIPGKRIEISLASTFSQGRIFLLASQENKTLLERIIPESQLYEPIIIPVTKAMVGIVYIQAIMIQNNRVYIQNSRIQITNPANKLNVKLQSFRDKVRPGSDETWRIKVKDGNENTSQVELLALMYDSSLDYFAPNQINMNPFHPSYEFRQWQYDGFNEGLGWNRNTIRYNPVQTTPYPAFNWAEYKFYWGLGKPRSIPISSVSLLKTGSIVHDFNEEVEEDAEIFMIVESSDKNIEGNHTPTSPAKPLGMIRRQLQETAFFLPTLKTDNNGEVQFSFTMPESVTKWRFMTLAHRQDGASGTMETFITSSREIMVMPNLPRLVREGDELVFSTKIINTTDSALTGTAWLTIKDAVSGKEIIGLEPEKVNWSANANSNTKAEWSVKIPSGIKGLLIRVSAATGAFQDGEEHLIPVLPVKMVITETMPIALSGKGKHHIEMESLVNAKNKEHQGFTFTYTQNAAWEMLGVLPWLIERPYENTDQVFNRYFAVSVARQIFKDNPQIERVLKSWAAALPGDEDALLSALEKNPELKNTLLAATPWLTEAKNDTERRRRLASLVANGFLDIEQSTALTQLRNLQMDNGAWSWYSGMQPSEFVTSEILSGFGYLKKIGIEMGRDAELSTNRAIMWLQGQLQLSRDNALKNLENLNKTEKDSVIIPDWGILKNLYALSFFTSKEPSDGEIFWIDKVQKHYQTDEVTGQAMVALVLSRYGYISKAQKLLLSIKEKAIKGERNEWFYKTVAGPYWYQAPVERQVIVLETIRELQPLNNMIAGMEDWLISQKRTQDWKTTRATVSAIYSLATSQRKLFENQAPDQIKVGGQKLVPSKTVSGSGFFSQSWNKNEVKPALGNIEVRKNAASPSWATMHWSYIEKEANVQKGGFMDVTKSVFKRVLNNGVEEWYPVTDSVILSTGDRLMVRLLIEAPQVLDFVHVNDKRASVMEPLDVFSGYVWKSGLGYYASVTDAGADFFIDHLPKGKYTLTYELVVSHKGVATSGPAIVQCFYAPEFSGHSSGTTFSTK